MPGIVHVALSPAVLPFLPAAQRTAGRALGSAGAVADSKQTLLSTYLSAVLLVGLLASSLFGWSWADPVAALVIAAVAVKEGRDAWRGDACCGDACCGPLPTTSAGSSAAPAADASGCRPGCDCC